MPPRGTPGLSGGPGGGAPGGAIPGSGRAPGTGRRNAGYKGLDRWEYWWEYNKDRFLARARRGPVTGRIRRTADPLDEIRESVLLPALREASRDRRTTIRAGAMLSIGKIGRMADFRDLYRGFKDPDPEVRKAAILGMSYLGTREVSLVLERTLVDSREDDVVRAYAAAALGLSGADASAPLLARLLLDRKTPLDLRAASAMALGFLDNREGTLALLTVAGTSREDTRVRAVAVTALGRQGDLAQLPTLLLLLRDREIEVRRAAAIGIGALPFSSPAEQLLERAKQAKDDWLAGGALSPEAGRSLDDTIARLEEAAKADAPRYRGIRRGTAERLADVVDRDPDLQVQAFALMSLAGIPAPEAPSAIRHILERKSHRLKAWAGLAAGVSGDVSLAPYLIQAWNRKGEDPSIRAAMAIGLGLLQDHSIAADFAEVALDPGQDPDLRGYSITALGLMWDSRTPVVLSRVLATRGNPSLHRNAALAGGLCGGPETGARLVSLMEESNDLYVKAAVAIALGYLRDTSTAKALAKHAADGHEAFLPRLFSVIAVGYLGDRRGAPPTLSRLAWHHDYRVAVPALQTLTSLL